MKGLLLTSVLALGSAATAWGRMNISVHIGTPPYYGYAPYEVVYVERYVPAYDVPRVLVVSRYAHVPPPVIVNHYRGGWGWDRIYNHYSVPRSVVYGRYYDGPPYGRAYGHYKYKPKKHHHRGRGWRY